MANVKVPLSLNELAVERYHARDPATGAMVQDPALTGLVNGMRSAREVGEQLVAAYRAIMDDPTQTPEARLIRAKETTLRLAERAATHLDSAREKAVAELKRLEAEIFAPPRPRDPAAAQLEAEIRSRLSAMPEKQRKDAIAEAIERGDDIVCGAVLRDGPAWLVGMGDAEREMRRATWRGKRYPKEVDRMSRLKKALEATERGGTDMLKMVNELAASPNVMLAEAAFRQAQEAKMAADG